MSSVAQMIPRIELWKQIDAELERKLLYFQAPAGYGKSVAVSMWCAQKKQQYQVLCLDAYDNDFTIFCRRFATVLAALFPDNTVLSEFVNHANFDRAPDEFCLHAVNTINSDSSGYIIFDDLHCIENEIVLKFIATLVKRLPDTFRLFFLSRNAPPPDFSEFVVKEQVAVFALDKLVFSPKEIKQLYQARHVLLQDEQAAEVHRITGGWAIGVTAVLLSKEPPQSQSVMSGHLDTFIKTQVWEKWDDASRKFMVDTAFEEDLYPDLCTTLTGSGDSREMLQHLMLGGAFIKETNTGGYCFHKLFRAFLLTQAQEKGEAFENAQLNAAGEWYLKQNNFFKAVERFAAGKNPAGIAKCFTLLEQLDRKEFNIEKLLPVIRMVLDDRVLDHFPSLYLMRAYSAFQEGKAGEMSRFADKFYEQQAAIVSQNPGIEHKFLRIMDFRFPLRALVTMIHSMPNAPSTSTSGGSLTQHMPLVHRSFRDFSEYALDDMEAALLQLKDTLGFMVGKELDMLYEALLSGLYYEKGELQLANTHALRALSKIQSLYSPESKFCATCIFLFVTEAMNDMPGAAEMTGEIDAMIEKGRDFYLMHNWLAVKFRFAMANGERNVARQWLENHSAPINAPIDFYNLYRHITTVRAHIVMADFDRAIVISQKVLELCEAYRRPLDVIEVKVLLAIACWQKKRSHRNEGLAYLEQAVLEATPYRYIQVFANEGADLVNMLSRLQQRANRANYQGELDGSFTKVLYMRAVAQAKITKGLSGDRPLESTGFTKRQTTVMRMLCEGKSYRMIAEEMGIKFSTVRSHIDLIYQKLNVTNATDAVLKINENGLLNHP